MGEAEVERGKEVERGIELSEEERNNWKRRQSNSLYLTPSRKSFLC